MIRIKKLSKTYAQKNIYVRALHNINLCLPNTGLVFIVGKSGSGKSTLLNLLGALDSFDDGDIIVNGKSMIGFTENERNNYRYDTIGFVFQDFNLIDEYNVEKNITIGCNLDNTPENNKKVLKILDQVELTSFAKRKINTLSGGQMQRVAIARALLKNPPILLCDEPTGQLDSETSDSIFKLLKDISKNSLVIVVSHDVESAEKFGDRIITIKDGEVANDTNPDVMEKSDEEADFSETKKYHQSIKTTSMLGFGFLKRRPIRLCIALIISMLCFTMFCLSDAVASYKKNELILNALYENNNDYIAYKKVCYWTDEYDEGTIKQEKIDLNDIKFLKEQIPFNNYYPVYDLFIGKRYNFPSTGVISSNDYYKYDIEGMVELTDNLIEEFGYKLTGELPKNKNEVVITQYAYEMYKKYGIADSRGTSMKVNSMSDIIGQELSVKLFKDDEERELYENNGNSYEYEVKFKITGIIDTKFNYNRYLPAREYAGNGTEKEKDIMSILNLEINQIVWNSFTNLLFVKDGYYEEYLKKGEISDPQYLFIIIPLTKSFKKDIKFIEFANKQFNYSKYQDNPNMNNVKQYYTMENEIVFSINRIESRFEVLTKVIKYVSLGLILIVVGFMAYYFSGVIQDKEREIGILRSFGASKIDITNVFSFMALIAAVISILLALFLSLILIGVLNNYLINEYYLFYLFYRIGLRQIGLVVLIELIAFALGLLLPLIKLLKKKPVDIIARRN